jgi:hypothetical protein
MGAKSTRQRRTRKHRRWSKAIAKHGRKAAPVHKAPSGRTGSVRTKQLIATLGSAERRS